MLLCVRTPEGASREGAQGVIPVLKMGFVQGASVPGGCVCENGGGATWSCQILKSGRILVVASHMLEDEV